jgi:chromosome segregation ATPase
VNWRIRRARLEAAGPADARYDDVTLSFTADGRAAPNAVVLLRNGGGKSLLLSLLFKSLLPRRADGTKTAEEQRAARPVVLADECATVAIEWEHRDDGRLLVTGHSFERGEGEESRWIFEPLDGVLTLDDLPLRDGRRRRTRAGLMKALDALGQAHPRLRFRAVTGVRAWEDELFACGIDPAILRYQARLNRGEGGDDDELRFNSPEAFARFVLQMVLEDEPLAKLQQQVQTHAEQLARRTALALEAEFCRDAAALLQAVAATHGQAVDADAAHATAVASQRRLAGTLDAAIARGRERRERLLEQQEPLERRRRQLEAIERDLDGETRLVRARTERLVAAAAEEAVAEAAARARATDAEHAAWQLVETLVALSEAEAERDELADRVSQQERGAADARAERRDAALALAGALLHAAGTLDEQARQLAARRAEAERRQSELGERIEELGRRQSELNGRRGTLEAQLDAFARATERLRADGLLRDGERPSSASARIEAEREDLAGQQQELVERIAALRERREAIAQRRDAARDEADAEARIARELADRRDHAVARLRRLVTDAVQDALDVAAGWQPLDEPAGAERALERARAAADQRRATVANEIDARTADQRSLERDGLLAIESDVERVCAELADAGIEAHSALRYLADTASADAWARLIQARPGIAAGVVVVGSAPAEAVAELTHARVRPPRRPLIVARAETLLADAPRRQTASDDAAAAVLLPAAGAYDRAAGEAELEQVSAALEELRTAYERHGELSAELARVAATLAGEVEALRGQLPPAAANDRRLLGAVARTVTHHEERAAAARERAERETAALRDVEASLSEAERQEQDVARRGARCERALERLGAVDDLDVAAARAELARLGERLEALVAEVQDAGRERDELIRAGTGLEDRLAQVREEAATLRRRAAELPLDGAAPVAAAGSLAALTERLSVAEQLLQARISDGELRARMAVAEQRAGRLRAEVERAGDAVRERAASLASSAAGIDAQRLARGRREAKEAWERALRDQGEARTVRDQAAARLSAAESALTPADRTRTPALLDTLEPADPVHGAALLARLGELRAERERDVAENRAKLHESQERIALEEHLLEELVNGRARLAVEAGDVVAHGDELPSWTRRRERIYEQVTEAVGAVDAGAREQTAARERLRGELQALADLVAGADERVSTGITTPLRAGEALAADAGRLEGELRTRAGELDRMIGELERHRQAIVAQLLTIGAEGVRKLDRVASATTLPREEALGAWSGKQFARVRHRALTDEREREREIGRVLDAAVEGQARRRGLDLAFAATMALLQERLEVSVLKPHPQPDDRYHPIEVVGPEFSGGEELTIKLVLFCAVSAVRTAERSGRARSGRRAGPLLIDNPIGTASRESLVDLQLRLARHLDAQFIPFTGLEGELNVTGRFATTVALTNDKDLLSGMRYVRAVDPDSRPPLPPRPAGTPADAAVVTAISYTPGVDVVALADDARRR